MSLVLSLTLNKKDRSLLGALLISEIDVYGYIPDFQSGVVGSLPTSRSKNNLLLF